MASQFTFLTDAKLVQMANSKAVTDVFPFIAMLARAPADCRTCTSSGRAWAAKFDRIRAEIAGMADDRKAKLKTVLAVKRVDLIRKVGKGRLQQVTF